MTKVDIDVSSAIAPILEQLVAAQAICAASIYAALIGDGVLSLEQGVSGMHAAADALDRQADDFVTCGIARCLRQLAAVVERGGAPDLSVIQGGKTEG